MYAIQESEIVHTLYHQLGDGSSLQISTTGLHGNIPGFISPDTSSVCVDDVSKSFALIADVEADTHFKGCDYNHAHCCEMNIRPSSINIAVAVINITETLRV